MKPVTIYTRRGCGHCRRSLALFDRESVAYEEIDVSRAPALEAERVDRSGGAWTVPQVFVGDHHVGGGHELDALEARGALDPLLHA